MNLKDKIHEILESYGSVGAADYADEITEDILNAVHESLDKDKMKWSKFRVGGDV